MQTNSRENEAFVYSLKLLGISARSRKVLGEKLEAKGFPSAVVESTLARLEKTGFLDDKTLAAGLVNRYSVSTPSGRRRIDFEMKRRGVPAEIRREALESLTAEQERESALELARLKWQRLGRVEPQARRKRVYDFLLRRGFDHGTARHALAELKAGDQEEFNED
ncbi:MAG TPA: regulatory protein RecX [Verrucomicrobiae bacterium]|jgi:regulatory protein|nr:regulatory protein RecX [Verrucomicrobiae bacterium]